MENTYNLYNLEAPFKNYLLAGNINPISIRNYLSDYRYFTGWMGKQKKHSTLSEELIGEYKNYLITSQLPIKTVNRRLSTLRKFCSFCISQGWLKENAAKKVANIIDLQKAKLPVSSDFRRDPIFQGGTVREKHGNELFSLNKYKESLTKKGLPDNEIDQYVADVNEFLSVISS